MLELKGLSYQVEDNGVKTEILRGIDLTIEDNKFVVITGPNSCEGYAEGGNFCGVRTPYKVYFVAEFDARAVTTV